MKNNINIVTIGLLMLVASAVFMQSACSSEAEANDIVPEKKALTNSELIARGQYLTTVSLCNDCHSPKLFTEHGPVLDSAKLMSGHPQGSPLPAVDKKSLRPGNWILFSADATAYVGPWGMSFAANLTPDSNTGIGAWSEETFINTLRTGRHLGQAGGRDIAPPMPWEFVGKMSDEDLKAVYTYLKALPAVNNRVPAPIPPVSYDLVTYFIKTALLSKLLYAVIPGYA